MTAEPGIRLAAGTPFAGSASAWHAHVAEVLAACKNKATDAEIVRLAKGLARLQGAAGSAMEHPHEATSFAETLEALSHG